MDTVDLTNETNDLENEIGKVEAKCAELLKVTKHLERQLNKAKAEYTTAKDHLADLKLRFQRDKNKKQIESTEDSLQDDWVSREFKWTTKIKETLKKVFKFDNFRDKQLAAINATLSRKNVLLVMPTGGGKSLIYQMPTFVENGFAIVVSPLLSLIDDQLRACKVFNINARAVHGSVSKDELKKTQNDMVSGQSNLKLVFVTPEWLAKSKRFMSVLKKCYETNRISRLAIDEVHCCSSWGHDFRPDYQFLGIVKEVLPNVPFIGLTATATANVLVDIQKMLNVQDSMIITAPFNRSNLFYKVLFKPNDKESVINLISKLIQDKFKGETGIIYTNTVAETLSLATDLRKAGFKTAPYNANLEPLEKTRIHEKWLSKHYQIVVATIAFGMGIDKPDVRFVIHYNIPRTMETLYQESGRAGRDGKSADCIVLFSLNDYLKVISKCTSLSDEKKALSVLEYCIETSSCRRSIIAQHFEQTWDSSLCNKMCDICSSEQRVKFYDVKNPADGVATILNHAEDKLTLNKLVDLWLRKKSRTKDKSNLNLDKRTAEYVITYLLLNKYLAIDKGFNLYNTICYLKLGAGVPDMVMRSRIRLQGLSEAVDDGPPRKKVRT